MISGSSGSGETLRGARPAALQGVLPGALRHAVSTSKLDDTTSPRWRQSGVVTADRGDTIEVRIVDKDVLDDDLIAVWSYEFAGPGEKKLTDKWGNTLLLSFERVER